MAVATALLCSATMSRSYGGRTRREAGGVTQRRSVGVCADSSPVGAAGGGCIHPTPGTSPAAGRSGGQKGHRNEGVDGEENVSRGGAEARGERNILATDYRGFRGMGDAGFGDVNDHRGLHLGATANRFLPRCIAWLAVLLSLSPMLRVIRWV